MPYHRLDFPFYFFLSISGKNHLNTQERKGTREASRSPGPTPDKAGPAGPFGFIFSCNVPFGSNFLIQGVRSSMRLFKPKGFPLFLSSEPFTRSHPELRSFLRDHHHGLANFSQNSQIRSHGHTHSQSTLQIKSNQTRASSSSIRILEPVEIAAFSPSPPAGQGRQP